jgi:hypothetical protein
MMISVAEPLLVDLALENERLDAEKKAAEEQRAATQPAPNTRRASIVFERGRSTSFSAAFSQRTIPAPEEGIDGISRVDSQKRRQNFGGVDHLTPKGRATDVKNKLAASRAREKAAIKLAAVYSKRTDLNQAFNVNDILEMRAGMMPWASSLAFLSRPPFWRLAHIKKRAPWAGARGAAKINPGQNCPFLCAGPETRTHVYFIAA